MKPQEKQTSVAIYQARILTHLVNETKVTASQAQSLAPSEAVEHVIPDITRMASNEDAVVAAVAAVLVKPMFVEVEEGRKVLLPDSTENYCVYDGIIFLTNPLDQRAISSATAWARQKRNDGELKLDSDLRIGVISASKLDALRNVGVDDEELSVVDTEQAKVRAQKRLDGLVLEAAGRDATDIHLQPTQGDKIQVRFRIDGKLRTIRNYPVSHHDSLFRVVIEDRCGLSLETIKPQDGKFDFEVSGNKKINIRVSSIPVQRGSDKTLKLVLRLLGNNTKLANLDMLNLSPRNLKILKRLGSQPNGLFAVTGPTGSGKTTTQAAMMLDIYRHNPDLNFHTIEEPVEILHEGMTHTECGPHLTFPDALRAFLRQDPDVIYVGEMRDDETADLGYKAAQTGHLVLTTLHTNNSHESIQRLERMNVPSDVIATNTSAFAAQRLVRALCPSCKVEYILKSDPERAAIYAQNQVFGGNPDMLIYKANPRGCKECGPESGGMKGRRGVLEILEFTPEIQEAVLDGVNPSLLRRSSILNGTFHDLWDDGLRLVKEGHVSLEELERHLRPYMNDRIGGQKANGLSYGGSARQLAAKAPQLHSDKSLQPQL